jgi:energy-coupling factor transporter ATP-binding protein EcfA2
MGDFEVSLGLGVRAQELQALLAENSPEYVHFCGHGAGEIGLVFQDEQGKEQFISTAVLSRIFKIFANDIHCTVLNACDSQHQAEAIVEHIDYVVGMSQPILDQAAHLFSIGFYKGLAARKSIEQAYEMGCVAIQLWSETNSQTAQSRQYRKLEIVAADTLQLAQPQLHEHLKPVLLKKRNSIPPRLPQPVEIPTQPDFPAEFLNFIHQEINRKQYKDQARAAYDSFGLVTSQTSTSLTKSEHRQRQLLLGKVKQFWIEGFLQPSLQGVDALPLEMRNRSDMIELDPSYEGLQATQIYGEIGQGRTLLILGSPGSGKTIALLQLAQRLIQRSEENLDLPIPVVLNLSSWARKRKPIVDWLIDELQEKYHVPKSLSEPWIQKQQLILLLDGLDEVKEEFRNDCVIALNRFIGLFPQTEVAVCSRVRDYEGLTEHLKISVALCLQPLSPKQVYQFLEDIGGTLAGLKKCLKSNPELEAFAQTPLILYFMSVAYQGWSEAELSPHLLSTPVLRQQHLFDTYINCRLEQGATSEYTKDQVLRWLSWLAERMVQEKRTIFLIERMQPSWLQNQNEKKTYRMRVFIISGIVFGLTGALIGGLFFERIYTLIGDLELGKIGRQFYLLGGLLVGGLSGAFIGGILTSLPKEILPLEKFAWSWQRAKSRFMGEMFIGVVNGLIFGLILGLITGLMFKSIDIPVFGQFHGWSAGLILGLAFGLFFGVFGGLVLGLISGIGNSAIDRRTVTNQGIYNSWKNCLIVGLGLWVMLGLIDSFIFELILRLISNDNSVDNF